MRAAPALTLVLRDDRACLKTRRPNEIANAGVLIGRVAQAQDIANRVLFLASDASSYMTAAELVIDGGMTGGPAGADNGGGRHMRNGATGLGEWYNPFAA